MKPLDIAISHAGGAKKVADAFEVQPMAVSQWKKRGIPAKHVPRLVAMCGNQVDCHSLRPDVFPKEIVSVP